MNNFIPTLGVDLITRHHPGIQVDIIFVPGHEEWPSTQNNAQFLFEGKFTEKYQLHFVALSFEFFPRYQWHARKKNSLSFLSSQKSTWRIFQLVSVVKNHDHCKSPRPGVVSPFQMAYMILKEGGGGPNYLHLFTSIY